MYRKHIASILESKEWCVHGLVCDDLFHLHTWPNTVQGWVIATSFAVSSTGERKAFSVSMVDKDV